jgi:alpha-ketoglutarate-dependent taurine dioxygenase
MFLDKQYKSIFVLNLHHITSSQTIHWVKDNLDAINEKILKHGGILLRGTGLEELSCFEAISNIILKEILKYEGGITPRTQLSPFVYTSTDYDQNKPIPLHNECAYDTKWPDKILFFCIQPAERGGETILADSKKILKHIGEDIYKLLKNNNLVYVRHYNEKNGSHWKNAFRCKTVYELIKILNKKKIQYNWDENQQNLTTFISKKGIIQHPTTKEDVWFNQVILFNPQFKAVTVDHSPPRETSLPIRDIYFENGMTINKRIFSTIKETYDKCEIRFTWEKGDLLILDNMLMSHGRSPYEGNRKIVVSMGK